MAARRRAEIRPRARHLPAFVPPLFDVVPVRQTHRATLRDVVALVPTCRTAVSDGSEAEPPILMSAPQAVPTPRLRREPLRSVRLLAPRAHLPRSAPTPPPPGRARAALRGERRGVRPHARGSRSGRAGPVLRGLRPCQRR